MTALQLPTLTLDQYRQLIKHAAALDTTPDAALDHLLSLPPLPAAAPPRPKRWEQWELDLVSNPHNSPRTIARKTGRTVSAVSNKRLKESRRASA